MEGEDYCGLLSIEDKEEKKQETRKKTIQMKNVSQHLETGGKYNQIQENFKEASWLLHSALPQVFFIFIKSCL